MVFSRQKSEMLEKFTHYLLESLDFFINSLINELNQYELKDKKFLLFILRSLQFF